MAEQRAAGDVDATEVLPVTPGSDELSALSRRERRRLERLAQPMETWTAEEEMIATGQVPTMTPEMIAEQERLARQRAAEADAEARAAAVSRAESNETPAAPPLPERVATTIPEPAAPEPEPASPPEPEAPQHSAVAEVFGPDTAVVDDPANHAAPALAPEPAAPEPAADGIPEAYRNWFPPGSLQARAFEARQREEAAAAAAPSNDAADEIRRLTAEAMAGLSRAHTGAVEAVPEPVAEPQPEPTTFAEPLAAPEPPAFDDAQPVAPTRPEPSFEDLLAAARADEAEPSGYDARAYPVPEQPEPAVAHTPEIPAVGGGVDLEELWRQEAVEPAHERELVEEAHLSEVPPAAALPHTDTPGVEPASFADVARDGATPDVPVGGIPGLVQPPAPAAQIVWDDIVTSAPLNEGPHRSAFEQPGPHPGVGAVTPASVWDVHPLTGAPAKAAPLADAGPVHDLPRPDLSALLRNPAPAAPPVQHTQPLPYVSSEAGTFTGATPTERRQPDLQPAGGARHFRWAHLAVIAAIAFVLGVVVWNIARAN